MTVNIDPIHAQFVTRIKPINGITPFTYRDGMTYLKVLESIIKFVNDEIVEQLNISLEEIVQELNTSIDEMEEQIVANEEEYIRLLTEYTWEIERLIASINDKTGPINIQRILLEDDTVIIPDAAWPRTQPVILQFRQDNIGGHEVGFGNSPNIAPYPDPTTNQWLPTSAFNREIIPNFSPNGRDVARYTKVSETTGNLGVGRIIFQENIPVQPGSLPLHLSVRAKSIDSPARFRIYTTTSSNETTYGQYVTSAPGSEVKLNHTVKFKPGDEWFIVGVQRSNVAGDTNNYIGARHEQYEATLTQGTIINEHDYQVNSEPGSFTEFTLTPRDDGNWYLDSCRFALREMSETLHTAIMDEAIARDNADMLLGQRIDQTNDDISDLSEYVDEVASNKVNRNELLINVKDHGVVGDGLTDDTTALNAVIQQYRNVFIPVGIYLVSGMIRIPSNSRIIGQGEGNTIIKRAVTTPPDTGVMVTDNYDPFNNQGHTNYVENIEISDLTIDGNTWNMGPGLGGNEANGQGSCLTISVARNVYIHDLTCRNGDRHGIDVMASVYGQLNDPYRIIPGQSEHILIENCKVYSSRRDDGFTTHDSKYITIRECYAEFEPNRVMSSEYQGGFEVDDGSQYILIENCYATGWNFGYMAKGHPTNRPSSHVSFVDCVSERNSKAFHVIYSGENIEEANTVSIIRCSSINLRDVQFTAIGNRDIDVYGYRNVHIEDFRIIGGKNRDNAFIVLGQNADDVVIRGVSIENAPSITPLVARGYISVNANFGRGELATLIIDGVFLSEFDFDPAYPLIRSSSVSVNYYINNVRGHGTVPLVQMQNMAAGCIASNVYSRTNSTPVEILTGGSQGTYASRNAWARGLQNLLNLL